MLTFTLFLTFLLGLCVVLSEVEAFVFNWHILPAVSAKCVSAAAEHVKVRAGSRFVVLKSGLSASHAFVVVFFFFIIFAFFAPAIQAGITVRVKAAARVAVSVAFIAGVKLCHPSLRLRLQNLRRQVSVTTTHIPYESKASSHRNRIRNRNRSHRVIVWLEAQSNP